MIGYQFRQLPQGGKLQKSLNRRHIFPKTFPAHSLCCIQTNSNTLFLRKLKRLYWSQHRHAITGEASCLRRSRTVLPTSGTTIFGWRPECKRLLLLAPRWSQLSKNKWTLVAVHVGFGPPLMMTMLEIRQLEIMKSRSMIWLLKHYRDHMLQGHRQGHILHRTLIKRLWRKNQLN